MPLPKKAKVGPHTYTLRAVENLESLTDQTGGVTFSEAVIVYDPAQAHTQLRDTLLHELLHCVIFETPLRKELKDSEEEEKLVWTLSPRILALLRDNPQLVAFLTEKE